MNIGERFERKPEVTGGEILGVYPEGQSMSVNIPGGAYQVMVQGFMGVMSKQLFDIIFKASPLEAVVKSADVVVPKKAAVKRAKKAVK